MSTLLQPFVLVVTAVLGAGYAYLAWRLTSSAGARLALAIPFLLVWIVPALYWVGDRDNDGWIDDLLHWSSYVSMAWLSFLIVLSIARDAFLLLAVWPLPSAYHAVLAEAGVALVFAGSIVALAIGAVVALRGPHVRHVDIAVEGLEPGLDGFRIAQVSDLHVGLSVRAPYVERVAQLVEELAPDLIAFTGDIVDGAVERLASDVAPLERLAAGGRAFFILGNHDCYAGATRWIARFRAMGMRVLLNTHEIVEKGNARILVAGVLDPAARLSDLRDGPRPDHAIAGSPPGALRLLLAHNPKVAPLAERAGFDLQLSGHTHAGQFFPWTLAIHLVHAPHVAGLSKQGRMWVYVSAGTGTWGPPVRVGTVPELTLIRLVRVATTPPQSCATASAE
jgi:predicted MPP superfamily phosphohydrolase